LFDTVGGIFLLCSLLFFPPECNFALYFFQGLKVSSEVNIMDRRQTLALVLPLVIVIIIWFLMLAAPSIHAARMTRAPDVTSFPRAELRASLLELWDFIHQSGVLELPGVMLDWGSLLGAVREGQLIEHDYDIDLRIPGRYVCTAYWMLQRAARPPYTVHATMILWALGAHPTIVINNTINGIHAGIEPYVIEYGRLHRGSYCWALRQIEAAIIPAAHRSVPVDEVLPLGRTIVHGAAVGVPRDAERMLRRYYGPDWRVPRIHKRATDEGTASLG